MNKQIDELKSKLEAIQNSTGEIKCQLNARGQLITLVPPEATESQRVLAQRILELVGPQGRLIVRERGINGNDLIRVLLPEFTFQFLLDSPEVVAVVEFERTLAHACLLESARAQKQMAAAQKTEERYQAILARLKSAEAALKASQDTVNKYATQRSNVIGLTNQVLRRWKYRNAQTNRRAIRSLRVIMNF